mgnify:CR=1 FL=1
MLCQLGRHFNVNEVMDWSSSYCSQLHFIDSDEALDARPGRASLTGVQFAAEVRGREKEKSSQEIILIY